MNKISNYFKYIYYYVNVKDSYLLIIIPHFVYLFCICLSHYSYSSSPRKISLIFPFPERTGGSLFWTTMVPYTCFYFCTITPCLIVSVCVCVFAYLSLYQPEVRTLWIPVTCFFQVIMFIVPNISYRYYGKQSSKMAP